MASGAYSHGVLNILNGTVVPGTTTTKIGLAQSSYAPSGGEQNLSTFAAAEATCSGYTGAFGGSGRKAATVTLTEQAGSTRVVTIFSNLTWSALGGAVNNTLAYAVWLREITNDASSIPLAFLGFASNLTTNGSDVLVSFDGTNGNVRWQC